MLQTNEELHDPTGRQCALAGRAADDDTVTDYCHACFAAIMHERGEHSEDLDVECGYCRSDAIALGMGHLLPVQS